MWEGEGGRGADVELHSFLISLLDGGEVSYMPKSPRYTEEDARWVAEPVWAAGLAVAMKHRASCTTKVTN